MSFVVIRLHVVAPVRGKRASNRNVAARRGGGAAVSAVLVRVQWSRRSRVRRSFNRNERYAGVSFLFSLLQTPDWRG